MRSTLRAVATCEKTTVADLLKTGKRMDGRSLLQVRDLELKFGKEYGHCEASKGRTRVLCQVTAKIGPPVTSRPNEGVLHIGVELSALASPAYENTKSSDVSVELSRYLERCFKESRAIDFESLCLVSGEKVWILEVTVTVLDYDGNQFDCSTAAVLGALGHHRRLQSVVEEGDITLFSAEEREPQLLHIYHYPISFMFGFCGERGETLLADPTELEETLLESKLVVAVNSQGEVCCVQLSGGGTVDSEKVLYCCRMALTQALDLTDSMKKSLEPHRARRNQTVQCR